MFDSDKWYEIWITISRNKMRSILTAFGVFWGIFMLIVMTGSGIAFERGALDGVKDFATNSCFLFTNSTSEAYKGFRKGRWWRFHNSDIEALKQRVPGISIVSPVLFTWTRDNNTYYNNKVGSYSIKGLTPDYKKIEPQTILHGRYINTIDNDQKRKVCVIGEKVYQDLFGKNADPIGKQIKVNGIYYQVIGVNRPITQIQIGGRSEESIIIPIRTLQQASRRGDDIDCIAVTSLPDIPVSNIEEEVKNILKERNSISPTDKQAVDGFNLEKQFKAFSNLFLGLHIVIWVVGIGTLLAGIVGVSNIMLVSVRERTNEIGIKRALGAKPKAILSQIMSESIILTSFAGLMGLIAGIGVLQIADIIMSGTQNMFFKSPQIPFSTAILATAVLLFSGAIAGILPTWRALQIKPIDALREE